MLSVHYPPLPQKHLKRGSSEKLFEYSSTEIPGEQVTDSQKTVSNADVNYVLVLAALFPHKHFFSVLICSSSHEQAGEMSSAPREMSQAGL